MNAFRSGIWSLLVLTIALAGCSTAPGRRSTFLTQLDAAGQREASVVYREILALEAANDPVAVEQRGLEYLDAYAGAKDEAHVLLLTARAALATGDRTLNDRLLARLAQLHPSSPHAAEGALDEARLARDAGRWAQEADALVRFYGAVGEDDPRQAQVRDRLRDLLDQQLDTREIDALAKAHPQSAIGSTASWLAARRLYDEGADPADVTARLEEFLREYPRSRYAEDARALLAEIRQRFGIMPTDRAIEVAAPDRIGLLVPLSGEYAALGQAMFDGALLCIEEHNRATGAALSLVALDTRGDEVVAVQAARRLIDEENVIAIVGCLLSPTTVAVAVLCQERGVPLISPTATKETIGELGYNIFQTNLTKDVETRLVARTGVLALHRDRFGVLYPAGQEGEALAVRFADEVERWGGRVVVQRAYDRNVTDFGALLKELRVVAPEALFVPAGPSEMRLIAPQLAFNDVRAQLLGPSSWNNGLLLREVGSSLDRAVFPSDVASIPESERGRFDELWQRRFPSSPSSAFGLKTFFAVRRIVDALAGEGALTRQRLRDRIEVGFLEGAGENRDASLQPLRMIVDGEARPFPAALFPGLAAAPTDSTSRGNFPEVIDDLREH